MKLEKLNIPLIIFAIAFFLEGLDAFSIANIPLSWVGVLTYVLIFIYLKILRLLPPEISHTITINFLKYFKVRQKNIEEMEKKILQDF